MCLRNRLLLILLLPILVACGGGNHSSNNNNDGDDNDNSTTTPGTGRLIVHDPLSANNQAIPLSGIPYTLNTSQQNQQSQQALQTTADGTVDYQNAATVTFTLLGQDFGPINTKAVMTQHDLAASYCQDSETPIRCRYNVSHNLQRTLFSIDSDEDLSNGLQPLAGLDRFPAQLESSMDNFEQVLAQKLAAWPPARRPVQTDAGYQPGRAATGSR
ncbi:MAG: hypothetical protein R3E89_00385 [Thiolinea sp.]